jgi:hypothetical protein
LRRLGRADRIPSSLTATRSVRIASRRTHEPTPSGASPPRPMGWPRSSRWSVSTCPASAMSEREVTPSVLPEVLEPAGRQRGVDGGVLQAPVAQVRGDGARVGLVGRELVATAVAQRVRVDVPVQRFLAEAPDRDEDRSRSERFHTVLSQPLRAAPHERVGIGRDRRRSRGAQAFGLFPRPGPGDPHSFAVPASARRTRSARGSSGGAL